MIKQNTSRYGIKPIGSDEVTLICTIVDGYVPVFSKSDKYSNMDQFLTYLNRTMSTHSIVKNGERYTQNQMIAEIIEALKSETPFSMIMHSTVMTDMFEDMEQDKFGTIWSK